ncbi:FAD/NAD(P)-binding domain-containing protein [Coniophora puteana RWD-64-598 SS2]|uniref:FAD/NAD(P)-binding domain-containing protein n=1 Tax=Coniophora puteana (strain RWD-64-598) TaxID=741705 RepID=A0A5M3MW69_CONPW|nr:FAD/NAD(P)-binding domain-containing protein [Coniophora puteana RWD-64-598 SS2]EIW83412.1 FAD/NAD(P)-binding domain-containing protein [Coniophora puteana RWD-64-598 SS2]
MHAALKLDVVIVGAGLAGIATAFRLSQAGHRVRVLDEHEMRERGRTAVHLPPNGARILVDWGFKGDLESRGHKIRYSMFRNMETGDMIGPQEWREDVMRELGSDYYFMHYHDLYTMLYDAAINAGARIHPNTRAVNVQTNPPRVTLSDRTILEADLIIGADGSQSLVKRVMCGEGDVKPEGHTLFTGIIPTNLMKDDAELARMAETNRQEWQFWPGTSRHTDGVLMRNGTEFALHIHYPNEETLSHETDGWNDEPWRGPRPKAGNTKLQRLIDLCPEMHAQKLFTREAPENWTDESGRLLLIGNAAHPVFPGWGYSCAIHLEDAEVLGTLLARISHASQLPTLLEGFQELREPHLRFIRDTSWPRFFETVMLPPGPERDARDAVLRRPHEGKTWDDSMLRRQFDTFVGAFGYNARDVAENWWTTWGRLLRQRSRGTLHGASGPMCSVPSFHVTMEEAVHVRASEL